MRIRLNGGAAAACVLAVGSAVSAGGPAVTYRVVAKTGDTAPTGGAFTGFGFARMNEQGEVAFAADTNAVIFSSGIWSEGVGGPGNLALVVREGTAVPGSGNTLFVGDFTEGGFSFFYPEINDVGNVGYSFRLIGTGAGPDDTGIGRQVNGTLQNVARPLQLAPGLGGATFERVSNLFSYSDNDEVALVVDLTGAGVNASNDETIWRSNANGTFNLVMREGAAVPGQPGTVYPGTGTIFPLINDVGEVSFGSYLNVGGDFRWSILRGAPGAPVLLAQEGMQTPLGPGTTFEGGLIGFFRHAINNGGDAMFPQSAMVGGQSRSGLWRVLNGQLQAVAVVGQPSPLGSTYSFVDAFTGALGKDGRIAYVATVTPAGAITNDNNSAIWVRQANGSTQLIAREGSPAAGLFFGETYNTFNSFEAINDRGQILFQGTIEGVGVNANNDGCLWGTRLISGPTLIMREGGIFEVAPGVFKIVSQFAVSGGFGSESGDRSGFNRLGQAVIRLFFTDETSAIVVATLRDECFGDIDGDLDIDFADLNILLSFFNTQVGTGLNGDLDLDGDVDFADLNLLLGVYNTNCVPL